MSQEKVKLGLVGAGAIAQTYVEALANLGEIKLVAIADINEQAANNLAQKANCFSFNSVETMKSAIDLDAVIICTPPATHREISLYCLERQIPVLCEKPLSINLPDAQTMYHTAKEKKVLLTMAAKFRYVEDVIEAKNLLDTGMIGEILLIENAFTSDVNMSSRWNSNPLISGGGVLIDNGTHSVDLMSYFLGSLYEVQAVEGNRLQGLEVEETVQLSVKNKKGIRGNIDLSWSINKRLEDYLRIYGTKGLISVGWKKSTYFLTSKQESIQFGEGYNKLQAFRHQVENFAKALRNEEALRMTVEDAIAAAKVIETAYRSLKQNQWLAIESEGRQ